MTTVFYPIRLNENGTIVDGSDSPFTVEQLRALQQLIEAQVAQTAAITRFEKVLGVPKPGRAMTRPKWARAESLLVALERIANGEGAGGLAEVERLQEIARQAIREFG